jgi:hypothetical protein
MYFFAAGLVLVVFFGFPPVLLLHFIDYFWQTLSFFFVTRSYCGSGFRCLFDPRMSFFPDPGSQTHISASLVIIKIVCQLDQILLYLFKNKIIFSFVKFMPTKKVGQQKNFPPSSILFLLDPESGMKEN